MLSVWLHVWTEGVMGSLNVSVSLSPQYLLNEWPVIGGPLPAASALSHPAAAPPYTVRPWFTTHTPNISTVWLQQTAGLVLKEKDISAETVTALQDKHTENLTLSCSYSSKFP